MEQKKKSTTTKKTNPVVATVRAESRKAIGANIFLGQSSDGKKSHFFTLARAWKGENHKKWNYSDRMYPDHDEALIEVISKASAKCKELDATITEDTSPFDTDDIPFPDMTKEAA